MLSPLLLFSEFINTVSTSINLSKYSFVKINIKLDPIKALGGSKQISTK